MNLRTAQYGWDTDSATCPRLLQTGAMLQQRLGINPFYYWILKRLSSLCPIPKGGQNPLIRVRLCATFPGGLPPSRNIPDPPFLNLRFETTTWQACVRHRRRAPTPVAGPLGRSLVGAGRRAEGDKTRNLMYA